MPLRAQAPTFPLPAPHLFPTCDAFSNPPLALLAFRAFPFDKLINRRVRYIWHTLAIALITVGLVAELKYANDRNKAVLWSLAQWMEVFTITLFLAQYCLGLYLFFYEGADPDMREVYIPFFAWLDIWVYVLGCFTVEADIVQRNTQLGCTYNVTEIDNYNEADPAIYYTDLPAGCRVSSGLGIVVLVICACTVYAALELKVCTNTHLGNDVSHDCVVTSHARTKTKPTHRVIHTDHRTNHRLQLPDISSTSAGWEAYKLTEEEQRKRRTWAQYFWSFWPFGKKKRNKRSRGAHGGNFGTGGGGGRGRSGKKKSNWIEKNDGDGVYYFNTKTKESTKQRPTDLGL